SAQAACRSPTRPTTSSRSAHPPLSANISNSHRSRNVYKINKRPPYYYYYYSMRKYKHKLDISNFVRYVNLPADTPRPIPWRKNLSLLSWRTARISKEHNKPILLPTFVIDGEETNWAKGLRRGRIEWNVFLPPHMAGISMQEFYKKYLIPRMDSFTLQDYRERDML